MLVNFGAGSLFFVFRFGGLTLQSFPTCLLTSADAYFFEHSLLFQVRPPLIQKLNSLHAVLHIRLFAGMPKGNGVLELQT